jgi:ABC-2 type transport system permease protein
MSGGDLTPRWLQLTRKELGDAYRSWRLQLLVGFFALIGAGIGYAVDQNYAAGLLILLVFLAPLVGIAFSQHTIVQKRSSGELSVLLSLPFSRRNIVLGAYLGRTAILLAALSSLALGVIVVGTVTGSPPEPAPFLAALLICATLGTVFVSLAIGISAAVRSGAVASAAVFGAYLLFAFQLWSVLPDAVLYLANGFSAPAENPEWARVFEQLSPFAAVRNLAAPFAPDLAELFPLVGAGVPAEPPVYMRPWFAGVVTLCWLVLPALLGYLRFERTDL